MILEGKSATNIEKRFNRLVTSDQSSIDVIQTETDGLLSYINVDITTSYNSMFNLNIAMVNMADFLPMLNIVKNASVYVTMNDETYIVPMPNDLLDGGYFGAPIDRSVTPITVDFSIYPFSFGILDLATAACVTKEPGTYHFSLQVRKSGIEKRTVSVCVLNENSIEYTISYFDYLGVGHDIVSTEQETLYTIDNVAYDGFDWGIRLNIYATDANIKTYFHGQEVMSFFPSYSDNEPIIIIIKPIDII